MLMMPCRRHVCRAATLAFDTMITKITPPLRASYAECSDYASRFAARIFRCFFASITLRRRALFCHIAAIIAAMPFAVYATPLLMMLRRRCCRRRAACATLPIAGDAIAAIRRYGCLSPLTSRFATTLPPCSLRHAAAAYCAAY